MPTPRVPYIYPVRTVREAKSVIGPEFQPDLFDKQQLYVNLDEIRDRSYLDRLYFELGCNQEDFEPSADYVKIIFSGHRGSGKSTELKRINNKLGTPDRYFTVFIDLEEEVEVGSFQHVDFYSLLLHKIIEELTSRQVKSGISRLQDLARSLLSNTEKTTTSKSRLGTNAEAGVEAGFRLFGFGGKASFKEVFSGENETSTTVRQTIRQNTLRVINELNVELGDTRMAIQDSGNGADILFIIDGSEKIPLGVYEELFIKNGNILAELNVNMLIAVPISAYYQIENAPYKFSSRYTVPMLQLGDKHSRTAESMKAIIEKRIDTSLFIEDDALNDCIYYSGGCIRQLFQVVHTSMKIALGKKIEGTHVKLAVKELGKYLWEYLDNEHLKVLKETDYRPAEKKVSELLYILILLKYNGTIKINPLLQDYSYFKEWQSKQEN